VQGQSISDGPPGGADIILGGHVTGGKSAPGDRRGDQRHQSGKGLTITLLFKPAESSSAYLKAGLTGFAGSGKTKTASIIAIGLVRLARQLGLPIAERPVYFLDTEPGAHWVRPDFEKAGERARLGDVEIYADLVAAVPEAEKSASVLIINFGDSLLAGSGGCFAHPAVPK
jgi:hypothetical protein